MRLQKSVRSFTVSTGKHFVLSAVASLGKGGPLMLSGMNADFIIIGGGMVGLSAHLRIAAPDFRHPDSG